MLEVPSGAYVSSSGNREVGIPHFPVNDTGRESSKTREPVTLEKFCADLPE